MKLYFGMLQLGGCQVEKSKIITPFRKRLKIAAFIFGKILKIKKMKSRFLFQKHFDLYGQSWIHPGVHLPVGPLWFWI